jgi:diaminopimelate epimerase
MEKIPFFKFESTGNDFVLIDNRSGDFTIHPELVRSLCDRRKGVGADGLIALYAVHGFDFQMDYFNSDGLPGTFCGNGGRAVTALASLLTSRTGVFRFVASDGVHTAKVTILHANTWHVVLSMRDVLVDRRDLIDTGSPHHVRCCENLHEMDIETLGPALRHDPIFGEGGCNVNFVCKVDQNLEVRTYERGVEGETLSCGTGVTAAAIYHALDAPDGNHKTSVITSGGELEVAFSKKGNSFTEVILAGKTRSVFDGFYYF